jgi:D-alanyl-D-alanine carboxypeptidase/Putative peptidoglycan binding domain
MPFLLSRGGNNVPLEVQRWQYFLLTHGFSQVGNIDAQFGLKTENATKFFQVQHNIAPVSGELDDVTLAAAESLGYKVVSDAYYDDKLTDGYPQRPNNLSSPTNADRNAGLGCFEFKQLPIANRADQDEIVILGSCDGSIDDWRHSNIIDVAIPQLSFASGASGAVTCHKIVAPHIQKLFARWAALDLLHLVRAYDGSFSPRYKRGQSPSDSGHDVERSEDVDTLSNHAFGSAFDINADDNPFKTRPALCPTRGSVRELVIPANELGFYWGGHFSAPKDGMHFEFAAFDRELPVTA